MPAPDEIALFAGRLDAVGAEYMITGATAAIIYGQPRLTNDLDVVLALGDEHLPAFLAAFPESEFYLPPESVVRAEQARSQRGHKLEYFREGGSTKHPADIRAILATTAIDHGAVQTWAARLGLANLWASLDSGS